MSQGFTKCDHFSLVCNQDLRYLELPCHYGGPFVFLSSADRDSRIDSIYLFAFFVGRGGREIPKRTAYRKKMKIIS